MAEAVGSLVVHDVLAVFNRLLGGQPSGGRGPVRPGGECRGGYRGRSGVAIEQQAYTGTRSGNACCLAPSQECDPRRQPDKPCKLLPAHDLLSTSDQHQRPLAATSVPMAESATWPSGRLKVGPLQRAFAPELVGPGSPRTWRDCAAVLPKCTSNPGRSSCQSGMRTHLSRDQAATLTANPDLSARAPGRRKWLGINGLCGSPESSSGVVLVLLYQTCGVEGQTLPALRASD